MEKEITVMVNSNYDELNIALISNGFVIKEEFVLNDLYMINNSIDVTFLSKLDILKHCILIRDVVGIEKSLVYKYKKYDNDGNILEQGKIDCPIIDINKSIEFMEAINYKKLFNINDKCIVYVNDKTELTVQIVNNKYIFIEMEDKSNYLNKEYQTIGEMIQELDCYNLPYNRDCYFVKKAEIILREII